MPFPDRFGRNDSFKLPYLYLLNLNSMNFGGQWTSLKLIQLSITFDLPQLKLTEKIEDNSVNN